jgi:hypothetical protein
MKTIGVILSKSLIIMAFLQIMQINTVYSQNSGWIKKSEFTMGMQINQVIDGSGHGMVTDADLLLKNGQFEISLGAFTQSKFDKIGGASFQFKFIFTTHDFTNLYVHYSFMYHYQNCLNNLLNEEFHPGENSTLCEYEKYNTMNHQIGLGLEAMTLKNLYVDIRIGIGGYFSQIVGEDNRNTNIVGRDDNGFSAMASLGLKYRFSQKFKKQRFGRF